MTMFQGEKEIPLKMFTIPLYGNALVIQKIVMNELMISQFFLSFGSTILLSALLIAGITKAFNSEKVMFHA
jgi:sodium transport system permease protein